MSPARFHSAMKLYNMLVLSMYVGIRNGVVTLQIVIL